MATLVPNSPPPSPPLTGGPAPTSTAGNSFFTSAQPLLLAYTQAAPEPATSMFGSPASPMPPITAVWPSAESATEYPNVGVPFASVGNGTPTFGYSVAL